MIKEEYNAGYDQEGKPVAKDSKDVPTPNQSRYWWEKLTDPEEVQKDRLGRQYYTTARPIVGDSYMLASELGHLQLDAVKLPWYEAHPYNRSVSIGRASAICILDTSSTYIGCLERTIENESWQSIGYGILSFIQNKVEYCRDYGINISEDEWSLSGQIGHTILADKGPVDGYDAGEFGKTTITEIVNNAAYRPDHKGKVESRFRLWLSIVVEDWDIPGTINLDRLRGDPDYVLDACLTPYETTQLCIEFVLWHNNGGWEMPSHILTREMMQDGVKRTPASVLQWKQQNSSGLWKLADPDEIRIAVLPTSKGRIERKSIEYRGLHYDNPIVEERLWKVRGKHEQKRKNYRVKVKGRRSQKVKISYDKRTVNHIWVRLDDGLQPIRCELSQRQESSRFRNCTWDEVLEIRKHEKDLSRQSQSNQRNKTYKASHQAKSIVARALSEKMEAVQGLSKSQRKSNITGNRQDARRLEQQQRLANQPRISPDTSSESLTETSVTDLINSNNDRSYIAAPKRTLLIEELTKKLRQEKAEDNEST